VYNDRTMIVRRCVRHRTRTTVVCHLWELLQRYTSNGRSLIGVVSFWHALARCFYPLPTWLPLPASWQLSA